jgi:hypothetical protein
MLHDFPFWLVLLFFQVWCLCVFSYINTWFWYFDSLCWSVYRLVLQCVFNVLMVFSSSLVDHMFVGILLFPFFYCLSFSLLLSLGCFEFFIFVSVWKPKMCLVLWSCRSKTVFMWDATDLNLISNSLMASELVVRFVASETTCSLIWANTCQINVLVFLLLFQPLEGVCIFDRICDYVVCACLWCFVILYC